MTVARFNAFVPGVPISQGSKKLVQPKGVSRPLMIDANPKLKAWRKAMSDTFAWLARIQGVTQPWDCVVAFKATYYFPAPAAYLTKDGRRKRQFALTAYDMDKLHRAVWDSLTQAGVICNDSRICVTERCEKQWCRKGQEPGVMVELWQIEDSGDLQPPDNSSSHSERKEETYHGQEEALREVPRAYEKGSGEEDGEASSEEVSSASHGRKADNNGN